MWDYSCNPKIMAMSIISVFALAYPMPPIYYIVRVAAWPLPLPPCPALKPAFSGIGGVHQDGGSLDHSPQATSPKTP